MVLGEPGKARDAYARAVKLRPDDPALKDALAQATAAAGVPGPAAPK
jgi:cytochrome c-type biogenesis protein CcmH/NrfG